MSKKSSRDRRSQDLRVRLTVQEKQKLAQLAGNWGLSKSDYVRSLLEYNHRPSLQFGRVNSLIESVILGVISCQNALESIERFAPLQEQLTKLEDQIRELSSLIKVVKE